MNVLMLWVSIAVLCTWCAPLSHADTMRLKSGRELEGTVLEDSADRIKFKESGQDFDMIYFKEEIESITTSQGTVSPKPALAPVAELPLTGNWWKYSESDNGNTQQTLVRASALGAEDVRIAGLDFRGCRKESQVKEVKNPDGSRDVDDCTVWSAEGIGKVKEECRTMRYAADGKVLEEGAFKRQLISASVDGNSVGDIR